MNADELFIDVYKLPKPLNKSEIYELFRKMEQGDQTAKEKIAMHNIRLVIYEVVNKFKFVKYDKKDLISIGNIGLTGPKGEKGDTGQLITVMMVTS